MKPEQIIEVVQGFMDGKDIQWKEINFGHQWDKVRGKPFWNFAIYDYRIKPEPREFILTTENNIGWRCINGEVGYGEKIKVIEVLEDE